MSNYVKFMELVGSLKHINRTGWVLRKVENCETVAGHMYRMALMSFFLKDTDGLDRVRVMEMSLVHDLSESIVGDITPHCGVSRDEKHARESAAMKKIAILLPSSNDRIMELFNEYEAGITAEAKFVKDLDRLDMVMQAFEYEKRDNCPQKLQEFFDSTRNKFSHPLVIEIVQEITAQRKTFAEQQSTGQQ